MRGIRSGYFLAAPSSACSMAGVRVHLEGEVARHEVAKQDCAHER
jgi:DNA-binding IscR family transcriptional regulator